MPPGVHPVVLPDLQPYNRPINKLIKPKNTY